MNGCNSVDCNSVELSYHKKKQRLDTKQSKRLL